MTSELCIRKKIEYELPEELWQIVKDYAGIFDYKKLFNININFKKISDNLTKNMLVSYFPKETNFNLKLKKNDKNIKLKIEDGCIKFLHNGELISANKLAIKKIKRNIVKNHKLSPLVWKKMAMNYL